MILAVAGIPAAELIQHLINGITLGGIYALIALGYTMVYGILKFINFAHGEILMAGTYAGLFFYDFIRKILPGDMIFAAFILSLMVGMTASALLGMLVEYLAYRPLRKASRLAPLLSAIGVSIILANLAAVLFGTKSIRYEYPFDNTALTFAGISITPHQILIMTVTVVLMILLKIFIDRTRIGKAMRATSENQNSAILMGIPANRMISLTFAVGSALAATAGILIALEYKVDPNMGMTAGLKAFIAAVAGGIGNITGAMIGGILLGVLETFGVVVFGIPQGFKDFIAFGILILILLFKPTGILGRNIREKV